MDNKSKDWNSWYLKFRKEFGCKNANRLNEVCFCEVCCNLERAWAEAFSIMRSRIKNTGTLK